MDTPYTSDLWSNVLVTSTLIAFVCRYVKFDVVFTCEIYITLTSQSTKGGS